MYYLYWKSMYFFVLYHTIILYAEEKKKCVVEQIKYTRLPLHYYTRTYHTPESLTASSTTTKQQQKSNIFKLKNK